MQFKERDKKEGKSGVTREGYTTGSIYQCSLLGQREGRDGGVIKTYMSLPRFVEWGRGHVSLPLLGNKVKE